jgi:dihydroorotate dehydrogenase electron transfer subunit
VSWQHAEGAHLGRRLLTVNGIDELGAYRVLRTGDPAVPEDAGTDRADRAPTAGWAPAPGQFAMLAAVERWGGGAGERPYLPRAFSIARRVNGESHFLLEDVGPGTRRLCELRTGDQLWALGPLGNGFQPPHDARRALLVGGGVGIAPLAILQDTLTAAAPTTQVTVLLGFRDRARAHGAALLRGAALATDDGSVGHHGLVTDLLAAELDRDPHTVVYACGPAGMLEGIRAMCAERHTPAQLALEAGMACGFGACFGCVVPRRGGGYLRVCVDGPVIDAADLEHVDQHAGAAA